jgi:hypothetical protein
VTPFSVTSLERGLDGVLVSAARVQHAIVTDGLSPEQSAGRIDDERDTVESLIDALVQRVLLASDEDSAERARQRLTNRLDHWSNRRAKLKSLSKVLAYERTPDEAHQGPLMTSPEMARAMPTSKDAPPFRVANSMREVQPEINLLVSPIVENLVYVAPPGSPTWRLPEED